MNMAAKPTSSRDCSSSQDTTSLPKASVPGGCGKCVALVTKKEQLLRRLKKKLTRRENTLKADAHLLEKMKQEEISDGVIIQNLKGEIELVKEKEKISITAAIEARERLGKLQDQVDLNQQTVADDFRSKVDKELLCLDTQRKEKLAKLKKNLEHVLETVNSCLQES